MSEVDTAQKKQENKPTPPLAWKITGVILVLGGAVLLVFTPRLPFVFGLILILAGVLMFIKENLEE